MVCARLKRGLLPIESGAFKASSSLASHADEIYVYDNSSLGKNKTIGAIYYYWSGAWRKSGFGTIDFGDDLVFTAGSGVIIRAAPAASPDVWSNRAGY